MEIPSRFRRGSESNFKAKLIASRAEQLGGELENQIYCFIKDKHSMWKSIPLGTGKLRGHFLM